MSMSAFAMSGFPLTALALPGIARSALPWTIQLPKRTAQGFNLLLVGVLLALGQFKRLQQFFHVLERGLQSLDDFVYIPDSFLN